MVHSQQRSAGAISPTADILLYVTDLVSDTDDTLASACELAGQHGAEIEVIHVVDVERSHSWPDAQMGAQHRLETLGRRLKKLGEGVKSLLLFGAPEDVIAKRATDVHVRAIAFGSNGSSLAAAQQKLISSVMQRVTCPVVTIHSKPL